MEAVDMYVGRLTSFYLGHSRQPLANPDIFEALNWLWNILEY